MSFAASASRRGTVYDQAAPAEGASARRPRTPLLTYACLSFGQTSIGNNEGTASLYTYFASTAIIFLLVLRLPPNGPPDWLSARRRSAE